MASGESTCPTKDTCNKDISHGQCAAAQDIGPQNQVQHLIAFASTILTISVKSEKKSPVVRSVKILSRDPMLLHTYKLMSFSSKSNGRDSRLLDAIANISISQARGETVAVAVQLTNTDIQLIVASNNTLPASTLRHLKSVWDILKDLCQDYRDYYVMPNRCSSRKRPSLRASVKLRKCASEPFVKISCG